jgi:hypothetical protein
MERLERLQQDMRRRDTDTNVWNGGLRWKASLYSGGKNPITGL